MKKILTALSVLILCAQFHSALADETSLEQLRQQVENLKADLPAEMQTANPLLGGMPATPRERLKQIIDSVNRNYSDFSQALYAGAFSDTEQLIPVAYASRISGYIEVSGIDTDPVNQGWSPLDLQYRVREEFIGYMILTRYFNTRSKSFTQQREYMIGSISTSIRADSVVGRQCVKRSPRNCEEWASFATASIDPTNHYPSLYEWVILGDTETGGMSLKIDAPTVYFSSLDKRAGKGLGCYGTTLQISREAFQEHLKANRFTKVEAIGQPGSASNCDPGSTIELNLLFCDKSQFADLDNCKQMEILLASMQQALALRDAYGKAGAEVTDLAQLQQLATKELSANYPAINLMDDQLLDAVSAKYKCGDVIIPDQCKACLPKPLCTWEQAALQVHEDTHKALLPVGSAARTLLCGTTLDKVRLYPDANKLERAIAQTYAEGEYAAYDQQARYLGDKLRQLLLDVAECTPSHGFLTGYEATMRRLNTP